MASAVNANGYGLKLDKAVGNYIANVDADVYTLNAGEPVRFSFMLWDKERVNAIDFDNVWVRITKEGSFASLFAGQIGKPDFGGVGMTYLFSKPGNYEVSVRFQKAGKDLLGEALAEASFPLAVAGDTAGQASQSNTRNSISWIIIGLIVGAATVFFLKTPKKEMSKKMLIGLIAIILALIIAILLFIKYFSNSKSVPTDQAILPTNNSNQISQPPQPAPPQ